MKYLILLPLLFVINISHAQRDSTAIAEKQLIPIQVVDSIIDYNIKMLNSLQPLIIKKNANIKQAFEIIKANTALFKTQLLLTDLKLSETQIALYNVEASLKRERKKNFWKTVGFGVGGVVVGVVVGSLVFN